MSVDTSLTTALSALVIDRQRCCSAQYVPSIAFEVARIAETQRQQRHSNPIARSSTHNRQILAP
jgi:hypothetical protein